MTATVLLTDFAWPDDAIERSIIEAAGLRLVSGPAQPAAPEQIEALVQEHQPAAILTCWAKVSARAIQLAPQLRIVARLGVGLDNIDTEAASARGVWVTNVPDYCVEEVSDHALALALAWSRGLIELDRQVRSGQWNPAGARLRRFSTLTCGVVGYGRIGQATARKLAAFGCTVLAHRRTQVPQALDETPVRFVSLDELLRTSDITIIHLPLTPQTHHLFDRNRLAAMKPASLLINVSRGAVVDTDALVQALQDGHLSAASLDVLESEPMVPPALLALPGVTLTPHVAFSSDASLAELRRKAAQEVVRVLRNEPPLEPCNSPIGLRS